ncbi:DinB family protein [Rhodococcus aerolatus]
MSTELGSQLAGYLQQARDVVVWKLDGLPERDVRRPLTPTGTNLLGLVKHLAGVEAEYLGSVFGRPFPEPLTWLREDAEPGADLWATTEESRADVLALYRRVWAHSDATVAALPLDAVGEVPWWAPASRRVTLGRVLVHLVAETHRHAGHADVVRELVDGAAGHRAGSSNLPDVDAAGWARHRARLQDVADRFGA